MSKNHSGGAQRTRDKKSRRNIVVFGSLLAALGLTSVLLLALAPAPLAPNEARSLFAVDTAAAIEDIFQTARPMQPGHWQAVYLHQAAGHSVLAAESGDHFVIGNGDGAADGEIQLSSRWSYQQAARPAGATVRGDCISICLAGDLDRKPPTAQQLQHLALLVSVIQRQCGIPAARVMIQAGASGAAGIGRQFPREAFFTQLER